MRRFSSLVLLMALACTIVAHASSDCLAQCVECAETKTSCTSMVVGRLATVDGSTMSGHTCDGNCDFRLEVVPRQQHDPYAKVIIDYKGVAGGFVHDAAGQIPQVGETYKWFKCEVPCANEYQVFIGENTCSSREELWSLDDSNTLLDWYMLPALGLQRGKTAREVICIIGTLVEEYGMRGTGESYLITDPIEAWLLEIPGYCNEWVAQRIPDDHVCPHANRFRIAQVDPNDTDNFVMSPGLITFAQERGVYSPEKDGPFSFEAVYNSKPSRESLGNRRREWRLMSLMCPSIEWDPNAMTFPVSVKPEMKISVEWWISNVWRDVMEGTLYDLTKGMAAGPFGNPIRQSIQGISFERPISTSGSGYTWISQARAWLPHCMGGVLWYSMDAPRSSCYVPFYVGIESTPESWRTGDYVRFSHDAARWYFQAIDSISQIRYRDMNTDVRLVFDALEKKAFGRQQYVEDLALTLWQNCPECAADSLTSYSQNCAIEASQAAEDLFYMLLSKYVDGKPRTAVDPEWADILKQESPK